MSIKDHDSIDRIIHERPDQLRNFKVRAIDGEAGVVSGDQSRVDEDHLIVHVGSKLFGSDVVVEADVVDEVNPEAQEIHVDRIVGWVKESPKLKHYSDH